MEFKNIKDTYFMRLELGKKIIATLKQFCTKQKIRCGYFLA